MRRNVLTALVVLGLSATACGGGGQQTGAADDRADDGGLTGQVRLDGSSTVGPLSEVAAELFMESHPGVRVTVAISGTGGGFQKFCIGETDGNDSSRLIKDSEIETCEENGVAYDFVQVANDALSILVNNDHPLDCISVEAVRQMWDEGSAVRTWSDVEGLDLPPAFADEPLTLYGPGADSGTFDYFTEAINGEEGRIRNDYVDIGEDDAAAVTAVQGDVGASGYVPFSYYQEVLGTVKGLAVDGGDGCVEPTPENVQNGAYAPLGRGLFVYFSDVALSRPEVLEFANFYVQNASEIAELAGFVGLTDEQTAVAQAKVDALAGGS